MAKMKQVGSPQALQLPPHSPQTNSAAHSMAKCCKMLGWLWPSQITSPHTLYPFQASVSAMAELSHCRTSASEGIRPAQTNFSLITRPGVNIKP